MGKAKNWTVQPFPSAHIRPREERFAEAVPEVSIVVVEARPLSRAGLVAILAASRISARIVEAAGLDEVSCSSRQILIVSADSGPMPAPGHHGGVLLLDADPAMASSALPRSVRMLTRECDEAAFIDAVEALIGQLALEPSGATPARPHPHPAAGVDRLTAMQFRVLELIGQGLLNKQIAYRCSIGEATVKSHVSEIFRKLGVQRRSEAAILFTRLMIGQRQDRLPDAA
ncbi:MAG: response regulator transcription factor [Beijerinckiaceae bacterium]|nr:response regulator transcription factor [Beijerinckiaceae bacterium]